MVPQCAPNIGDCVIGQLVHIHPADIIALLWLGIDYLAVPFLDMDKEVDALIPISAMHDAGVTESCWFDPDSNLFQRLARRGGDDRFIAIQMPGRDAVLPIRKSGIETADQQDLVFPEEK